MFLISPRAFKPSNTMSNFIKRLPKNLALIIETFAEPKQRLKRKIQIPIATEKDGDGCVFYDLLWSRQLRK